MSIGLQGLLLCILIGGVGGACNENVERLEDDNSQKNEDEEKKEDTVPNTSQSNGEKIEEVVDETERYVLFAKENSTGHGSIATTVRRFGATEFAQSNRNYEVSDSAELGTVISVKKAGFYRLRYVDKLSTGRAHIGFTKNAVDSQLTTQIQDLPAEVVLKRVQTNFVNADDQATEVIWEGHLNAGDVVRAQDQGQCNLSDGLEFSVYQF